jgi:hypothetical protein
MPEEVTKKIWIRQWRHTKHHLMWNEGLSEQPARKEATRRTTKAFGPCPEDERRGGLKAAMLRLIGGQVMPESVKTFVNRWGVLISVFYLGAVAILRTLAERGCESCDMVAGVIQTGFGMLALTPDPAMGPAVVAVVAGGFAVYGGTRKVISLAKKRRAGAA